MFKLTTLLAVLASAAALKSDSPAGKALLSKSRQLEDENDNNNEGDANNNNYEWLMNYSMVFQSCHRVSHYNGADGGDDGQAISYSNVVKYKLCPSNKCRYGCTGAEYLTDMDSFVDSWTEWTMNDQEYKCEQQREKCSCDYYDDQQACYNSCFSKAGMSECIEQEADDNAFNFNLQEWLECRESEALDTYGNALYVGPKCSENGEQINLGVFKDDQCTQEYSSKVFATYYGGNSLPYQNTNIVAENCISCKQMSENNYYAELEEICEETYPSSAKCETNLAKYLSYPQTDDCAYVTNIKMHEVNYKPISGAASTFFAVVFFISTIVLAGVAVHLYKLNNRKIELHTDAAVV